jgi:parallel beta-helix repeat protein
MIRKEMKQCLQIAFMVAIFTVCMSTVGFAATYYVATNGSDTNGGMTLTSPFKTIQRGLNVLQPGDTCLVRGGTYYEGLVLKQSGTISARITLDNYNGETVTISSGNIRALRTGGRRHYYTIEGLRFISNYVIYSSDSRPYTLDFQDGIWDGFTDPNGGNNGFILRNCYIEGSIHFYGHYILMENCELNGRFQWYSGVWECFAPSHHNTYRNNKFYAYANRGIWSMNNTDSVTIEKNIVHDCGSRGIDLDGAQQPVLNAVVRGNTVYNVSDHGIEMENAFNSVTENNVIYDSGRWGISYINYGYGPDFTANSEYRDDNTNAIVRNNLIYNSKEAGIILNACRGVKIYNNTIYKNYPTAGYYAGITLLSYGGFPCYYTDIRNNIVSQCDAYAIWMESPSLQLLGLIMSNNLYYHPTKTKTHYVRGIGTYTLSEYQAATGKEQNSLFSNPAFANVSSSNFHLTSTSKAIETGVTLADVPLDLDGLSRPQGPKYDMGAYEFPVAGQTIAPALNLRVVN